MWLPKLEVATLFVISQSQVHCVSHQSMENIEKIAIQFMQSVIYTHVSHISFINYKLCKLYSVISTIAYVHTKNFTTDCVRP